MRAIHAILCCRILLNLREVSANRKIRSLNIVSSGSYRAHSINIPQLQADLGHTDNANLREQVLLCEVPSTISSLPSPQSKGFNALDVSSDDKLVGNIGS